MAIPRSPISPSPTFAWLSRLRAERHLRVVDVQAAQAVEADFGVELVDDRRQPLGVADLVAGGEQVAAVEADADPLDRRRQLDQLGELVEVAAERALGAGRVLEQDRAALGLGQRPRDRLRGALHRRSLRLVLARAGMQDDAVGADRVAESQRVGQRGQRLRLIARRAGSC